MKLEIEVLLEGSELHVCTCTVSECRGDVAVTMESKDGSLLLVSRLSDWKEMTSRRWILIGDTRWGIGRKFALGNGIVILRAFDFERLSRLGRDLIQK